MWLTLRKRLLLSLRPIGGTTFSPVVVRRFFDMTLRWRRESRANPSLKWGSRAWQYGTIPRGLWMITEAEKAISGSKTAEFQSLPLGSFSCYLDPKLLIILSFRPSAGLAAGEFTVYKKSRSTALSADPAKNLILFSYLESQGAHANLP